MDSSKGLAGNKVIGPGSVGNRQENNRPGIDCRRSPKTDFLKFGVLCAALALSPKVSFAQESHSPASSPASAPSHAHAEHGSSVGEVLSDASEEMTETGVVRTSLAPGEPTARRSAALTFTTRSFTRAGLSAELYVASSRQWEQFESNVPGIRFLAFGVGGGYRNSLSLVELSTGPSDYSPAHIFNGGASLMLGVSSSTQRFVLQPYASFTQALFPDHTFSSPEGERITVRGSDSLSLGPVGVNVFHPRSHDSRGLRLLSLGITLPTPLERPSNVAGFVSSEVVWSRHDSTVLTLGASNVDDHPSAFAELIPLSHVFHLGSVSLGLGAGFKAEMIFDHSVGGDAFVEATLRVGNTVSFHAFGGSMFPLAHLAESHPGGSEVSLEPHGPHVYGTLAIRFFYFR